MQLFQKIVTLITGKRWLMIALGVLGIVLILGLPTAANPAEEPVGAHHRVRRIVHPARIGPA